VGIRLCGIWDFEGKSRVCQVTIVNPWLFGGG
jgi:hypothetical protein